MRIQRGRNRLGSLTLRVGSRSWGRGRSTFLIPMLFYTPIYIAGFLGSRLVEDELETQAQMKIALSVAK
jgi:hypothetical protein